MSEFKEIRLSDYGFFILSPSVMNDYILEKKIKPKKVLEQFESNNDVYLDSIYKGIWLPISGVDAKKYNFCTNIGGANNFKGEIIKNFGIFNLTVGDDGCVWVGSLGSLNSWDYKIFKDAESDVISYKAALTGQVINKFIRFNVPKGCYIMNLLGVLSNGVLGYKLNFSLSKGYTKLEDPRNCDYGFGLE